MKTISAMPKTSISIEDEVILIVQEGSSYSTNTIKIPVEMATLFQNALQNELLQVHLAALTEAQ